MGAGGFARLASGTSSGVWQCLSGLVALAAFGTAQAARGIDRVGSRRNCLGADSLSICLLTIARFCAQLTPAEIEDNRALYFDAGAIEVWICNLEGYMSFFAGPDRLASASALSPNFPK